MFLNAFLFLCLFAGGLTCVSLVAWLPLDSFVSQEQAFIWIVFPCWLKCTSESVLALPFESSGVAEGVKHGYIALKLIAKGFAVKAIHSIPFDKLKLYNEYTMPKGSLSRRMKVSPQAPVQEMVPQQLFDEVDK